MTWLDTPLVGFDTETTGVGTTRDRIVTAAVITRTPAGVESRQWLINPGVEIPEGAYNVHGISTEVARESGADPVIALEEIATALAQALNAGHPIVAYNAQFDLTLLEAELARHDLQGLHARIAGGVVTPVIDPLVLDRHLDRWRKGTRKLINVCEHYGVTVDATSLHAADADVLATLDVVAALARAYPDIARMSLPELHDLQREAHRTWAVGFADWLRSKGQTKDLPDPAWPVGRLTD